MSHQAAGAHATHRELAGSTMLVWNVADVNMRPAGILQSVEYPRHGQQTPVNIPQTHPIPLLKELNLCTFPFWLGRLGVCFEIETCSAAQASLKLMCCEHSSFFCLSLLGPQVPRQVLLNNPKVAVF